MQERDPLYYVSRYGAGGETTISPVVYIILIIAAILIFTLRRKYLLAPIAMLSFLIPLGQGAVLGPIHLQIYRMLIFLGWARLLWMYFFKKSTFPRFKMEKLDKVVLLYGCVFTIAFTILYASTSAFIDRLGFLYTTWGVYFLFRFLIRDEEDVDRMIKVFAVTCMICAVFMVIEQRTGQNLFGRLGGVPSVTAVREGSLRSQGPFRHPILAGTFGATLIPLFLGLWFQLPKSRKLAAAGFVAALTVAIASASSTPLLAIVAGVTAICLWPFRRRMRALRWAIVLILLGLQLSMKAPVWALIQRVDVVGGSSGFHRFMLVDQTIRHFWQWCAVGVQDSGNWGFEMWDTSNTYVDEAVQGGLLTVSLFIAVIVYAFKALGRARKNIEGTDRRRAFRLWALGSALLANAVGYFGITYFDQTIVMWYAFLAMIAAATSTAMQPMPSVPLQASNAMPVRR